MTEAQLLARSLVEQFPADFPEGTSASIHFAVSEPDLGYVALCSKALGTPLSVPYVITLVAQEVICQECLEWMHA